MNQQELLVKLSSLSPRTAFIYGLVLSGLYWMILFDDGSGLKKQIEEVRQSLNAELAKEKESEMALKEVDIARASLEALAQQYLELSKQLPTEFNSTQVYRRLDSLAEKLKITIRSKEPQNPQQEAQIQEYPILIEGVGEFSAILAFVKNLTTQKMIFRLREIQLQKEKSIRFRMKLSTFVFKNE